MKPKRRQNGTLTVFFAVISVLIITVKAQESRPPVRFFDLTTAHGIVDLETDPPFRLADASVVVEQAGTWGQFNFRLAPGKRWAIGRYRIELWVGDELVASTYFEVSPRTTVSRRARVFSGERTDSSPGSDGIARNSA